MLDFLSFGSSTYFLHPSEKNQFLCKLEFFDMSNKYGRKNHEQDHVRNILRTCGNMQAYVNVDIVNPLKEVQGKI